MKTKVLFYCTKGQPYLTTRYFEVGEDWRKKYAFNGKISCKCEVECEEIIQRIGEWNREWDFFEVFFNTNSLSKEELMAKSCINQDGLESYFKDFSPGDCPCPSNDEKVGYALHISKLKVFDEPLELDICRTIDCKGCKLKDTYVCLHCDGHKRIYKAPQNMMWVWYKGERRCLISIRPEWLCKILNGEKTIEVRKKILKGMM